MKLFSVFKTDFKKFLRTPAEMSVLFLMPLAFILPISFAIGAGDGYGITASNRRETIPVINQDIEGSHAQKLITLLSDSLKTELTFDESFITSLELTNTPACNQPGSACDAAIAQALVAKTWRTGAVFIPAGFSEAIDAGNPVEVELVFNPTADAEKLKQVEGVLEGAVTQLSLKQQMQSGQEQMQIMTFYAPQAYKDALNEEVATTESEEEKPGAIRITRQSPQNYTEASYPDTYQQTVPGYTVMYVFFIIGFLVSLIHEEQHAGTYRRLLSMPVSKAALLGGKMLLAICVNFLQVAFMFALGHFLFGLNLGNLLALSLLTLALSFSATGIGMAAATLKSADSVYIAPLIIGALLGGCMFPTDIMPGFLRTISKLVPHSWALQGYQDLMVRGQGLLSVLPEIGVLMVFGLVFFLVAVWRFEFDS